MSVEALYAIKKALVVDIPVERAWALFTERAGDWWPLATHSLGGEQAATVVVDADRIVERWHDGTEKVWGRMLVWEPPSRMVFTWEISEDCGTEVEVRFTGEGKGTRVELEHRGWESGSRESHEAYDGGWDFVLGRFEDAVA